MPAEDSALYCHPVDVGEWPEVPEIVERVALRSCARRGAAIDVVCDRGREQRSQIVFPTGSADNACERSGAGLPAAITRSRWRIESCVRLSASRSTISSRA